MNAPGEKKIVCMYVNQTGIPMESIWTIYDTYLA